MIGAILPPVSGSADEREFATVPTPGAAPLAAAPPGAELLGVASPGVVPPPWLGGGSSSSPAGGGGDDGVACGRTPICTFDVVVQLHCRGWRRAAHRERNSLGLRGSTDAVIPTLL